MKKLILFLAVMLILAVTLCFAVSAQALCGDADCNGALTTTDARYVLQAAVGMRTLEGEAFSNADYDGDGQITTTDARKTLNACIVFSSIEMSAIPQRTTYYIGAGFLPSGGRVLYTHDGRSEERTLSSSMITGFDSSTAGTKTVTVTIDGHTTSFEVDVVQKTVDFAVNGMFNSHMVLQRDATVPVFGVASDGVRITVQFANTTKTCVAKDGKWRVDFDAMGANSEGQTLVITSSTAQTNTFTDILIGDVWLCSGQSNMYWRVGDLTDQAQARLLRTEANNSNIRSFWAEPLSASTPQNNINRQTWEVSTSAGIYDQSAYSIAFAQGLQQTLGIPIGVATLCQGSTSIKSWLEGGEYYNAMIASVMPFRFKGVLWWQGETDCLKDGNFETNYPNYFTSMVAAWRRGFENENMPVLQTQLANYAVDNDSTSYGCWAQMQDLQARMIDESAGIYTVCNFDIFDSLSNIHPNEKKATGTRAANLALEKVYKQDVYGASPRLISAVKSGNNVVLTFTDVHSGLTRSTNSSYFFACGSNGVYSKVSFTITAPNQITLNTSLISGVKAVRYISNSATTPNVFGGGLPVFGFNCLVD